MGQLMPSGALLDLSGLTVLDVSFRWADVLLPLRHKLSGPATAAVPLDGSALLLVYRRDVLAAMGEQVPWTWDELAELAESYEADRPSWAPQHLLCAANGPSCDGSALFYAIWHSIAQSQGLPQGVYFRPGIMQPRARTAAFTAATLLFSRLWRSALPQPQGRCSFVHPGLRTGACAVAVSTLEQVKDVAGVAPTAANPGSAASDGAGSGLPPQPSAFGVAQLPGSPYVLDLLDDSNLVPCSAWQCPYGDDAGALLRATAQQPADGRRVRRHLQDSAVLNRVPFVPSSVLVGGIRSKSPVSAQLLAWHALSHLASPNVSLRLVLAPGSHMAPFRESHWSDSARQAWALAGYDARLANEGLDALRGALLHPNLGWGLAMPEGSFYGTAVSAFLARTLDASRAANASVPPDEVLFQEMGWLQARLAARYSPPGDFAAQYSSFLHAGSSAPAPAQPSPQPANPSSSGGARVDGRWAGIGVAIAVAAVAALCALTFAVRKYGWRAALQPRPRSRPTGAPPAAPKTTMVVTALNFALEAQQELLEQDWPAELLRKPSCAPVYTTMPSGFPFKRHAVLDSMLSRISMRPLSNAAPGTAAAVVAAAASAGGAAFSLSRSSYARLGLPRITSFGHSRATISQSPTLSLGRSRTPTAVRERASIDLGQLNVMAHHPQPGFPSSPAANGVVLSPAGPAAPPRREVVAAAALDLAAAPMSPHSQRSGESRPSGEDAMLSPHTGTATTPMSTGREPPIADLSDPFRANRTSAESDLALFNSWRSVPLHPLLAPVVPSGTARSAAAGPRPAQAGGPTRKPGELSRRLQELQEQQQASLLRLGRSSEEPPPSGGCTSTNSNGAWAVIHGGDAAIMLEDQAEQAEPGVPGTGRSLTTAAAAVMRGIVRGEYTSAPINVQAVSGMSGVSREPTGSGMATGGGAMTAGGLALEPEPVGASEPLPKFSMASLVGHLGLAGSQGRMALVARTPSAAPAHGRRPDASHSPLPHRRVTGSGPHVASLYATGPPVPWEVCTLEESLKAAVKSFGEVPAGERRGRLLWKGLRVRMGLHSGVASEAELTYNRASARTVYSGDCASIVRAVADSAQGGMVLLSDTSLEVLDLEAAHGGLHGPAAEALLVQLGRWRIRHKDLPLPLYLASSQDLAPRAAVLPPPRNVTPVGLSLYSAPVGMAAVAALEVPDIAALCEWDPGAAVQALALMEEVLVDQLASHRGFLVRRDRSTGAAMAAFAFPLDAVRWALSCRDLLASVVEWPAGLLAHEACREGLLHHHQPPLPPPPSALPTSRRGHGQGQGSGSGPLPSPVSGRGPTRPSMELSHALTASCDNTPVWTTGLTGVSGAMAAAAASHAAGTLTPDGYDDVRGGEACMSRLDSSRPSYRAVHAASHSVDMDSGPPPQQVAAIGHSVTGSHLSGGTARLATAALRHGGGSGTTRGGSGTAMRGGGGGLAGRLGSQSHVWASKQPLHHPPPPHSTSEGGALRTASSGAPPKSSPNAPPSTLRSRPFVSISSRVSAFSARCRATAGGYLEGLVLAGRTGAHSVTVGRLAARAGCDGAAGPGGTGGSFFHAQSLPVGGGIGGGGRSLVAPGGALTSCAPSPRDGATDGGVSSGCTSPKPTGNGLTVKTALEWARSDEMETEDGGDIFSTHLGSMDGLGPFTRPPEASASGAYGAHGLSGEVSGAEGDRPDAVLLRGPRIRVGVDCGPVDWGVSSSGRCLTYSGPPVAAAEKLASVAVGGQVLATVAVMRELHRMQAGLVSPEEPGDAPTGSELDSGSALRKASTFRGPAVVGALLPPASGRAGIGGSKQRRPGVFACRFTLDWEEALREHDLLLVQQTLPLPPSHSALLWNSPRASRMSPFASPWNWSAATRRKSKRTSSAAAGGAAPGPSAASMLGAVDLRRSQDSRCSLDVHTSFGPSPFGMLHLANLSNVSAGQPASGAVGSARGGAAAGPSLLQYSASNPLQGSHAPLYGPAASQVTSVASHESRGLVSLSRLYGSSGPHQSSQGAASGAAAMPRYPHLQHHHHQLLPTGSGNVGPLLQPAGSGNVGGLLQPAGSGNVLEQAESARASRATAEAAPAAGAGAVSAPGNSAAMQRAQGHAHPPPSATAAPAVPSSPFTTLAPDRTSTGIADLPSVGSRAVPGSPFADMLVPRAARGSSTMAMPPAAPPPMIGGASEATTFGSPFSPSRPSAGVSESFSLSLRHNLHKMSTTICSGSSAIAAGRSGEFAMLHPLHHGTSPGSLTAPHAPRHSASSNFETGFASGVVGALTPALKPPAAPHPDAARAWALGSASNRSLRAGSRLPSLNPGAGWVEARHPPAGAPPFGEAASASALRLRATASSDGYASRGGGGGARRDGDSAQPMPTVSGYVGLAMRGVPSLLVGGPRDAGVRADTVEADFARRSGSAYTLSLQSPYPAFDDPELWRDESYAGAGSGSAAAAAAAAAPSPPPPPPPPQGSRGRRV
ncbi:hypothetical protein GPECTOR_128g543 [Gonium pectorale]|uniref:Guanylate cyclase domain-containing protein n=1 Tax=Gonium pectorale TaxID=33097 RepID=A0A150FZZ2_GONPE|nr:hypothetical protein GPECTOR_128g543 [Gonium pectorale]|eukprot:KXZ42640.1 hypothetical protein GPECTOR_128g543 [Gonium pectorale]